jgi:spectinomycin phosphotransferase
MLEKPDLRDEKIIACLQEAYGLPILQVDFLPLGADRHTAVYRATAGDGSAYFLKLRNGAFSEAIVALPKFMRDQGITQVMAPLATQTSKLWAILDSYKLILYPYVEGRDGYEVPLSDRHWMDLGKAIKRIHTLAIPPGLSALISQEDYSSRWRAMVKAFVERVEHDHFNDPIAVELAGFIKAKHNEIGDLVERAERLARAVQKRSPAHVLCHSDLHAGNILIDAQGAFYIVDWDDPVFAPKERDLMFIGGGQGFSGHTLHEEQVLFYRGYGPTSIDRNALAYYRYERIVQDIALFCEHILDTVEGEADREQSLRYLKSNFLPDGSLAVAHRTEEISGRGARR